MLDTCPNRGARESAGNGLGPFCDRLVLGIAVLALLRWGEALADPASAAATLEQSTHGGAPRASLSAAPLAGPMFTGRPYAATSLADPLLTAPSLYTLPDLAEQSRFSSTDFRPRGASVLDTDPRLSVPGGDIVSDKTLLQRLAEFRTQNGVRVLTLWESGATALSIQTNRKGDPSLQWTSRLSHGRGTRGLLDRLFPVSVFGGTTHVTRSVSSEPSRVSGALSALHFGGPPP
ncbi:MAG TPA: hypothetical protein VME42_12885 [Steroidobacteraceae bacterium]|nr:hypothetical protein [Steroidobacteraceae bacterium]